MSIVNKSRTTFKNCMVMLPKKNKVEENDKDINELAQAGFAIDQVKLKLFP